MIKRKRRKAGPTSTKKENVYIDILNGDYLRRNASDGYVLMVLNILYGNGVIVVVRAKESLVQGEG